MISETIQEKEIIGYYSIIVMKSGQNPMKSSVEKAEMQLQTDGIIADFNYY